MTTSQDKDLKVYSVTSRTTAELHFIVAPSPAEACAFCGWLIGDCYVKELRPTTRFVAGQGLIKFYLLPCNVCSFQYSECQKPPADTCPVDTSSPDLIEWLRHAFKAHLCHWTGDSLTPKDHANHRKPMPLRDSPPATTSQLL